MALTGFYNAHPFLCSSGHGEEFTAVLCPHSTGTVLRMGEVRLWSPEHGRTCPIQVSRAAEAWEGGGTWGAPVSIPWVAGEGC